MNWVNIGADNGLAPNRWQCWLIVDWTLGNKFQWNLNRNSYIFIQENAIEYIVCQIGDHFVQGRWVNLLWMAFHAALYHYNPWGWETHWMAYVILMVTDVLVPNRCQAINNYHADSPMINPLRAKFFRGSINIYLHFISLFHIDMTQVRKFLPQVRPGLTYST